MSGRIVSSCVMSAAIFCAALPAQAQRAFGGATNFQTEEQSPSTLRSIVFPKPQIPASNNVNEAVAADNDDPAVAQAIGCLIAGGIGTSVAVAAGSENVVNIVAGGLVTPANSVALYTAVVGVIFGTFCAVGQAVTPLYVHLTKKQSAAPRGENAACTMQHSSQKMVGREEDFSVFHASLNTPATQY